MKILDKQKTWHYVTDKLPPNPKENEDGSIQPLNYICACDMGNGKYDCNEFMYLGNGVWNGENEKFPIYAWLGYAVPKLKKECM